MSISTLLRYFLGNREAILKIGSTPDALWLGAAFVFSAALAREYDAAYLMHEPWRLVLPLGASLVTSFLLFSLVFMVARERGLCEASFLSNYRPFLALYWLTAPLAWLYAIPVERFMSPGDATIANLCFLGIVALWRVVLMIRVVQVLYGASAVAATFVVMLFADSVALTILIFTPLPILRFMGGIQLTESEIAIQNVAYSVGFLGAVTWLIWLFGYVFVGSRREPSWINHLADRPKGVVSWQADVLAGLSLAFWPLLLTETQPEQKTRYFAEDALRHGNVSSAIDIMSFFGRDNFPPHWDVPPRLGYGENQPSVLDAMEAVLEGKPDDWVHDVFFEKFLNFLGADLQRRMDGYNPDSDDELAESRRIARILEQLSDADRARLVEYIHRQTRGPLSALADQHSTELFHALRKLFPEAFKNAQPRPAATVDSLDPSTGTTPRNQD